MPGAQFQALLGTAFVRYRYFRWTVTDIIAPTAACACYNAQISVDGGTTWLPTQTMTTNSAPSPLVASSITEQAGNEAFRAFDQNGTTFWAGTTASDGAGHYATSQWLQIDVGNGNNLIVPSKFRIAFINSGADLTWKNFDFRASQTGAFAGEEILLKTISGQGSQTDQVNVVYNVP